MTTTQFFADTVAVPLTLLASGIALLVGALHALRRRPAGEGVTVERDGN